MVSSPRNVITARRSDVIANLVLKARTYTVGNARIFTGPVSALATAAAATKHALALTACTADGRVAHALVAERGERRRTFRTVNAFRALAIASAVAVRVATDLTTTRPTIATLTRAAVAPACSWVGRPRGRSRSLRKSTPYNPPLSSRHLVLFTSWRRVHPSA